MLHDCALPVIRHELTFLGVAHLQLLLLLVRKLLLLLAHLRGRCRDILRKKLRCRACNVRFVYHLVYRHADLLQRRDRLLLVQGVHGGWASATHGLLGGRRVRTCHLLRLGGGHLAAQMMVQVVVLRVAVNRTRHN